MVADETGKGAADRPPLPSPATVTEMYLAAILDELKAIRQNATHDNIEITGDVGTEKVLIAPARQQARKGGK